MCGIVGFFNSAFDTNSYPETLCKMLSMIKHRGPDEAGYYFDEKVGLGSVRLSVIDINFGQQPMIDRTERYHIVYNGEVYNYIELRKELESLGFNFKTTSDTEVVLYSFIQWGTNSFSKLNGGFSFAIYDKLSSELFLVRDRFGERPLYYSNVGSSWIFASEIKSFLPYNSFQLEFDIDRLKSTFNIWTPLPDSSVYKNVFQVPIGGYVVLKTNSTPQINYYYSIDFNEQKYTGSENDAIENTKNILSDSVKIRLRSDVEVGTYLSGGIDSSIITSLVTRHSSKPIKTFSISFEDTALDESKYQKEVSDFLGTNHESIHITYDDITRSFRSALWHSEIPVFRTAFVPMYLLSKMVHKSGIKVVLTGEGADEFFLGYDFFKETLLRQNWNILNDEKKKSIVQSLNPFEEFIHENALKLMAFYEKSTQEKHVGMFAHEQRFSSSSFNTRILKTVGDGLTYVKKYLELFKNNIESFSVIERAQWLEVQTLLSGYLLSTQGDRMSFSSGVESRLPFLDVNVVKWANSLPLELKLKDYREEKYILKKSFKGFLQDSILTKNKHPYRAPDASAFLHNDNPPDYLSLVLSKEELGKIDFINSDFAIKLIEKLKTTPKAQISNRENQAFIFLLSTVLINNDFIKQPSYIPGSIDELLVKRIDGRKVKVVN